MRTHSPNLLHYHYTYSLQEVDEYIFAQTTHYTHADEKDFPT